MGLRLDRANMRRLGIVWAAYPGLFPYELVSGEPISLTGTYEIDGDFSRWGVAGTTGSGNGALWTVSEDIKRIADEATFAHATAIDVTPAQTVAWNFRQGSVSDLEVYTNAAQMRIEWRRDSDSVLELRIMSNVLDLTLGVDHVYTFTLSPDATVAYRDGVQQGTGTTGVTSTLKQSGLVADPRYVQLSAYNPPSGSSYPWKGRSYCGVISNRAWTSYEVAEFSADPGLLLAGSSRHIWNAHRQQSRIITSMGV